MSTPNLGYIPVQRSEFASGEFGDPFWQMPRAYSYWEAWLYCRQLAQWQDRTLQTQRYGAIPLKRGEFIASIRTLADQFNWSVKQVRTWIKVCLAQGRITAQKETQAGTVYLIVEYDSYQDATVVEGTPKGTPEAHLRAPAGHKNKNVNNVNKQISVTSSDVTAGYSAEFETLWNAYPKRSGSNSKADAYRQYKARIAQGVSAEAMHDGVVRYAAYVTARGIVGSELVKMAATFLGRGRHFEEAYDVPTNAVAGFEHTPQVERAKSLYAIYVQHGFTRIQSPESYKDQVKALADSGAIHEPRRFWAELQVVRPWTWMPQVRADQTKQAISRIAEAISAVGPVLEQPQAVAA